MKDYHFFFRVFDLSGLLFLQNFSYWVIYFHFLLQSALSILMLIMNFVLVFLCFCYLQFESINESINFNNIFHLLGHEFKNKITTTK